MAFSAAAGAPAGACVFIPQRGQVSLQVKVSPRPPRDEPAPDEQAMSAGDLMTIVAPSEAVFMVLSAPAAAAPALVPLDEATYRTLSAEGGGQAVPDWQMMGLGAPPGMVWKRFGAARAGTVYVRVGLPKEQRLIRVEIGPPRSDERGSVHKLTETDVGAPVALSYYDKLEIELPGEPDDGWSVTPEAERGVRLLAIEKVETPYGAPSRVRLRFQPTGSSAGSPEAEELMIRRKGGSFRFKLQLLPTPVC